MTKDLRKQKDPNIMWVLSALQKITFMKRRKRKSSLGHLAKRSTLKRHLHKLTQRSR